MTFTNIKAANMWKTSGFLDCGLPLSDVKNKTQMTSGRKVKVNFDKFAYNDIFTSHDYIWFPRI